MTDASDVEYLEATPQSRRRIVLRFLLAFVIGVAIVEALEAYLANMKIVPICDQLIPFRWLWGAVSLALVILSAWIARIGFSVLRLGRWPLPGTSVARRTPIQRGGSARWRAYALLSYSAFVLVGSVWFWYVGDSITAGAESKCAAPLVTPESRR
jgi:hypothetical protein